MAIMLGVAFVASTTAWLASSGSIGTNIVPVPGATSTGQIALIGSGTLSGQILSGGHLTAGVPVSRAIVAASYVDNLATNRNVRFSVAWTNAVQATLHGNDVIAVGLAYPVAESTGTCSTGYYVADSQVTSSGDVNTGVCVVVDSAATGRNVDLSSSSGQQGMAILGKYAPGGSLVPGTAPPASVGLCTTTIGSWCQPHNVGDQTGSTNVTYYLIAQVVNNGGNIPYGDQPTPGAFQFFVAAKAMG